MRVMCTDIIDDELNMRDDIGSGVTSYRIGADKR
jgi:hypothetical protein